MVCTDSGTQFKKRNHGSGFWQHHSLWNVKRDVFLQSTSWVVHEVEHVRQFNRYGFLRFAILYLIEYARKGYHNNRFEVEARVAEENLSDLNGIEFI